MRHIKGRVDFINEVANEIDPYGEERWEDPLPLKFKKFHHKNIFEWMKNIGIEEIDINKIKYHMLVARNQFKSDDDKLGVKYYMDNVISFIETLKDKYNFEDEDDYYYFLGCITTEGLGEHAEETI